MKKSLYVGIMSGTSMDAIDVVLVDFAKKPCQLLQMLHQPYPVEFQKQLQAFVQSPTMPLAQLGELDAKLGEYFAEAILQLLKQADVKTEAVLAIGSHGQTVLHQPNHAIPFTVQITDPHRIAARTGILTVADFRRRDIAEGGQGAPLVPGFHAAYFQHPTQWRFIVNIGGIANVTVLDPTSVAPLAGFDTGPGNTFLDLWCEKYQSTPYDHAGDWARMGCIDHDFLTRLLQDAYFEKAWPKSTGRDYFNLSWLEKYLQDYQHDRSLRLSAQTVQTTLVELTAITVTNAIKSFVAQNAQIILCGGGAHNAYLCERLQFHAKDFAIDHSETFGMAPQWIEACAFAWLAKQRLDETAIDLSKITGSKKPVVLGALYHP